MDKDNSSKQMGEVTEIKIGEKNVQIPSNKTFKKQPPCSTQEIDELALKEGETSSKSTTGLTGTEIGVGNENLNPMKTQVEKTPVCKAPQENTVTEEVYPQRALTFLIILVFTFLVILLIIGLIGLKWIS